MILLTMQKCKEEKEVGEMIKTLQKGEGIQAAELVGRKKDGTEFIVGLKASLIVDTENQPIGMTASMADITARKKLS